MLRLLLCLGMLQGCLERVTGTPVALDSRFTTQATTGGSDDTGAPGHTEMEHKTVEHAAAPPPQPFQGIEGEKVAISGLIVAEVDGAVDFDVARHDSDAEGGLVSEGKLLLVGPGPFEIMVPVSVGKLKIAAFQDVDKDGPSMTDPYAEVDVEVGDQAIVGLKLSLVIGGRKIATGGPDHQNAEHVEAPPGFGSGQAPPPDGQPSDADPFAGTEGPRVEVAGTITSPLGRVIDVDLFQEDASAPGGRVLLGKLKKSEGAFSIQVPISVGSLELDAFSDQTGDGPSADDPRAQVRGIVLSSGPVLGLELTLKSMTEVAEEAPEPPTGTDLEDEFARTRAGGKLPTEEGDGL